MGRLLAWLFPWRTIRDNGVWLYQEHARTGARRALRVQGSCWSPLDVLWLERRTGPTTPPPMTKPR